MAIGLSALAPAISKRPLSANSRHMPARSPATRAACRSRTMRSAAPRSVTPLLLRPSCERRSNLFADLLERGARVRDHPTESIEQMDHTRVTSIGQGRSAGGQAREIILPLVAQRIELRRMNDGLRLAAEVGG